MGLLHKKGIEKLEDVDADADSLKISDPVLFQRLEKEYGQQYLQKLQGQKM